MDIIEEHISQHGLSKEELNMRSKLREEMERENGKETNKTTKG